MTEILVCDDDLLQARSLAKTVKLAGEFLAEDYGQSVSVSAMGSPQEALAYVADRQVQRGIYFLDIEFAKSEMDGLDLAEELLRLDPQGQIVFVTTHSELALQTF
ncbi:response regulator [Lactobacillus delbrueckii]|nr:response regulator [Lactobacillus delbrueckii]EGD27158.1 accessory gene regulator protein A [Lactobacillus delbrueckii subsp. lactis DSM 20072]KRK66600.1 regulator protein [Lactobacillus delbrueckii subsp. lactis DSM 20072]MCD5441805.1 response regulator [Lactobacillus delbrueckii subsp. lactis]MCD5446235.1 response regulator [Lactobacillus delbrueckii subsp. lactis]MCD5453635.1 response regulator [Lactobacillus delbrueckii subsp. lactis]